MKTNFVIQAGQSNWEASASKTLTGAKIAASKEFCQSVGGKIKVGIDHGENGGIQEVAVKYGYDAWVTDPTYK